MNRATTYHERLLLEQRGCWGVLAVPVWLALSMLLAEANVGGTVAAGTDDAMPTSKIFSAPGEGRGLTAADLARVYDVNDAYLYLLTNRGEPAPAPRSTSQSPNPPRNGAGFASPAPILNQETAMQVDSGQLSVDSEDGGTVAAGTEIQDSPPLWVEFLIEAAPLHPELTVEGGLDYAAQLELAVTAAADATGVWPEAILAVLVQESSLDHYAGHRADGAPRVKRGDGGRAIGIAQVHRSPWEQYFSFNHGEGLGKRSINLDRLADNVLVCALILKRGGWQAPSRDEFEAARNAYAYYNSGKRGADVPRAARHYAINVLARTFALRGMEVEQ